MTEITRSQLEFFVHESWRIEGLEINDTTRLDYIVQVHKEILSQRTMSIESLKKAASVFAGAHIRERKGMDVYVGNHTPIRGGLDVVIELNALINLINCKDITPYQAHIEFETIHPFMDGNGRTGRLLWAWCMQQWKWDAGWAHRGFLHTWYYQSLENGRA